MFTRFLIVFGSVFLFSCASFKEIEVKNVEGFYLEKLSLENVEAQIQIKINNPNKTRFNIYPSEFDVVFSGMRLGKAKLNRKVRIQANSEEIYSFRLNSKLTEINPLDALNLLNAGKLGNIEVNGDLRVGKFFYKKRIPVNYRDKVKLFK